MVEIVNMSQMQNDSDDGKKNLLKLNSFNSEFQN